MGVTTCAWAATPGEVHIGASLREASMQGLGGPPAKLSAFRGKPLIINVWASWCGPCRQEMASLDRLSQRYGGKQFSVIGISTDDYPNAAMGFLNRSQTQFRQFIDYQLQMENMLGANHIPLTVLVSSQGVVLAKVYGAKEWDSPMALDFISKTLRTKLQ